MKKITRTLLFAALAVIPSWLSAQACYQNPSLEGTSQPHVVPAPWVACYGSPDTQPGQWGITQPASNGATYVSFLHSGWANNAYNEGMTQLLSPCLVAGQTYTFTVDLAHSPIYTTADPNGCYSSLAVYAGATSCAQTETLWLSGMITNPAWTQYTITFTPTGNWCYLSFSPYFINACGSTGFDYINCMMDNISCVVPASANVASQNPSCSGSCDGSAWATPTSGTAPFTYSWSPGGSTNDTITGLCPGVYAVVITDANSQTVTDSVTIAPPSPVSLIATSTDVSCNGGSNGTGSVTASGGTGSYTYNWQPSGGTGSTANNLSAGTYSVIVTDGNGCPDTATVTIAQPAVLSTTNTQADPVCFGSTGSAGVTVSGGTPGYSYAWTPSGGNGANATGLPAGSYTCTITDLNGCSLTQTFLLTQPPGMSVTAGQTNVLCNSGSTGTASVTVSGGSPSYTYLWSPSGGTASSASGLGAGTYTCTVTDAGGCTTTQTFNLTQPQPLALLSTGSFGCMGTGGTVSAAASGGVAPFTYTWSNSLPNGATQNVNPSQTTTYTVTVTDANGCTNTTTVTYTVNPVPTASFSTPAVNGVMNMDFTGGPQQICVSDLSTGATIYAWSLNGTPNSILQNPCFTIADTGLYCIELLVATAQNCFDTTEQCILAIESQYSIPNVFTPNGDGTNDVWTITNRGMKRVRCTIFNRWGQMVYDWDDTMGGWNGKTKSGNMASDGTYYYVAELLDFGGEIINETGFLELIDGK
ncbi:MAG: fibronectin type III domain-containing protein [Bacteroidetes bacterium]|nr:MAG: fibronectin type III domain-containing protein [Bacteroidota bacterium]